MTRQEDIWTCEKCSKQQGRHDLFFDGICEECHEEVAHIFEEGDLYYTIEENIVIESVWDDVSKELHNESSIYYSTLHEAVLYYKFTRCHEMLMNAVSCIESSGDKDIFLEGFEYFKYEPRISLCFDSSIEQYREMYGHLYINH